MHRRFAECSRQRFKRRVVKIFMLIKCAWSYNHSGEIQPAAKRCTIPGSPDGGIEWFRGPEPPLTLNLCDSCTGIFVEQNGPENVLVEAITLRVSEGSLFSPPRRETQRI